MYKLIDKTYLIIWTILTIAVIFTKSTVIAYAVLLLVLSQVFIIKRIGTIFDIFLLTTVAWGATLNLAFRMGNLMISDFSLLLLLLAMIVRKDIVHHFLHKGNFVIECLVVWFIIWGLVQGFELGNVLQDFKLFLYIFIPYIYLSSINIDAVFLAKTVDIVKLYVIVVFFLEATQLASVGLNKMILYGFGHRDVAIIVQFVPVLAALLLMQKNKAPSNIILQIICFLTCLFSFTRTIWITYLICIVLACMLGEHNLNKNMKRVITVLSFVLIAFWTLSYIKPEIVEKYTNAIFARLTDATNSHNTLEHRWIQSEALLKTKVLRPITIIGAGFGEITDLKNSVFMENSLLYYFWKYGFVATMYLLMIMLRNFWMTFRSRIPEIRAISISLLIVLVVGNFSGNLNLYYFVPAMSFVFAYPAMRNRYDVNGVN